MDVPNLLLKVIVCMHFFLSTWGSMSTLMPGSYAYVNLGVLLCGLWAIGTPQSADSVLMMLITLSFSVVQDIILLGLYGPRGHDFYENNPKMPESQLNEFRFALGMCILNLILKPFSGFVLLRLYLARSNETNFTIPGIDRIPGMDGMTRGGYENLDSNKPSTPYSGMPVETASLRGP